MKKSDEIKKAMTELGEKIEDCMKKENYADMAKWKGPS